MFNKNLKALRLKAGLSQKQVADHLTVSPQSVSKWESGYALPSIDFLPKLSEILNCDINAFFVIEQNKKVNFSELESFFLLMIDSIYKEAKNTQEIADFVFEHPDIIDISIAICLQLKEYKRVNTKIIQSIINSNNNEAAIFLKYLEQCELLEKQDFEDSYFVMKDAIDGLIVLLKLRKAISNDLNKERNK